MGDRRADTHTQEEATRVSKRDHRKLRGVVGNDVCIEIIRLGKCVASIPEAHEHKRFEAFHLAASEVEQIDQKPKIEEARGGRGGGGGG